MKPTNPKNEEFWDLFHIDGRFEKVIPSRGYPIPPDMYHMAVEVIPTDLKGHLLVTQRSFSKKIGPGKLEFPAGSVLSEEQTYVAARRELREETGLKAESVIKLGSFLLPRIHRTVYIAYIPDLCNAKITLQENETIGYAIITFREWLQYVAQEQFETSKLRYYTKKMLDKMESIIGDPKEMKKNATPEKVLQKVSGDLFSGYRTVLLTETSEEDVSFENLFSEEQEEDNP